ncbi:MAG: molybdate/tungstate import ATP-binding protein WtpC [Candidatus Micrarchaeota archaeon]|nr:MAG: molybdate/tungstate import ATP-binding protein WtpC [Candidatus Micrarchaeota archaeon]
MINLSIVDIKELTKIINNKIILEDITLRIDGNTVILGRNGAGKSTLLKCIAGIYKAESGSVRVFDKDPYTSKEVREHIGYMPDYYSLYDDLSVTDNLNFFRSLYKESLEDKQIRSIIEKLELNKYLNLKVGQLSRGTKQKASFIRAIQIKPKLMLLDEPTAFLDPISANTLRDIIDSYCRANRSTYIYVTQRVEEVSLMDADIVVIENGRVKRRVKREDLSRSLEDSFDIRLAKPISDNLIVTLKKADYIEHIKKISDRVIRVKLSSYKSIKRLIGLIVDNNYVISSISSIYDLLDDSDE